MGDISVRQAGDLLEKLDNLRAVDPACGSGAYLLGLLQEILRISQKLDTRAAKDARTLFNLKLDIIQNNLYGVDIDQFAVNIARLRLWLSLIVDYEGNDPPPLPNLDFKVETGDSLTAPCPTIPLQASFHSNWIRQFMELKDRYLNAHNGDKRAIVVEINEIRDSLRAWMRSGAHPDGFDWAVEFAEVFARNGRKGFDIVLANPPYGASVGDSVRDLYFNRRTDGPQSKDTYGLFMARALQLLAEGGQFCYIISDTWRTIRSHLPLRRRILQTTTVEYVLDLPSWIFEATVSTSVLLLEKKLPSDDHKLIAGDLRGIKRGNWQELAANLRAIARHGGDAQALEYARYTYPQKLIGTYENLSFFIASPQLYKLMSDKRFTRLGDIAEVKQGLATADNEYYLRKSRTARGSYQILDENELLTEAEIANLSDDEKQNGVEPDKYQGHHFLPYDKGGESDAQGGWLPNYYVPTQYFIDWSRNAVHRLRTATVADVKRRRGNENSIRPQDERTRAAVIRSPQYYFREGITASRVGIYSPTFRFTSGGPFDSGCSNVYCDAMPVELLCSILVSTLARYIFSQYTNHTVNSQVEDLKDIPIALSSNEITRILRDLVDQIVAKQTIQPHYPYYLNEQKKIDALIYDLYGMSEQDIREVKLWYCRRYPALARAQGVYAEVENEYKDYLERAQRQLTSLGSDESNQISQMIDAGESSICEFKVAARWNSHRNARDDSMRDNVVQGVAAFMNSYKGGTLLIGVDNSGLVVGLDADFRAVNPQRPGRDTYERFLRNTFTDNLGGNCSPLINISFDYVDGKDVCRIDVRPAPKEVYLNGDFYIRDGNGKRKLPAQDAHEYINERWPGTR